MIKSHSGYFPVTLVLSSIPRPSTLLFLRPTFMRYWFERETLASDGKLLGVTLLGVCSHRLLLARSTNEAIAGISLDGSISQIAVAQILLSDLDILNLLYFPPVPISSQGRIQVES